MKKKNKITEKDFLEPTPIENFMGNFLEAMMPDTYNTTIRIGNIYSHFEYSFKRIIDIIGQNQSRIKSITIELKEVENIKIYKLE